MFPARISIRCSTVASCSLASHGGDRDGSSAQHDSPPSAVVTSPGTAGLPSGTHEISVTATAKKLDLGDRCTVPAIAPAPGAEGAIPSPHPGRGDAPQSAGSGSSKVGEVSLAPGERRAPPVENRRMRAGLHSHNRLRPWSLPLLSFVPAAGDT